MSVPVGRFAKVGNVFFTPLSYNLGVKSSKNPPDTDQIPTQLS